MHMSLPERLYDQCYNISLFAGQHRWFKFTPTVSGEYTFSTTGSTDTYGELYQGSTLLLTNNNGGSGNNFSITRTLTSGTQYRLKVKGASNSITGSYVLGINVTAPTGVTVSPSSATVSAGSTKQLSATVSPSGAPQGVTWSSGNMSIATVNSSGLVSAVSPGTVTITASSSANSSKKGTCTVSVNRVPNTNAQNKTMWCWVAASKMVGVHNGGNGLNSGVDILINTTGLHSFRGNLFFGQNSQLQYTADTGQRQIAIAIHGNDENNSGNTANMTAALQFVTSNEMNVGVKGDGSLSSLDIDFLNDELAAGRWVVGNVFPETGIGHSVVIQSFDVSNERYTYYDPWTNGVRYFTRNELLSNSIRLETDSENVNRTLTRFFYCN